MTTFSDDDLRCRLDSVLQTATSEGVVYIRRSDGREFVLRSVDRTRSPLDLGFVDVRPTREEVVQAVREGRERDYEPRRE
ncbi:hypothetical protein [Humisphaera borealis]|uniref:Type II toxin-antitoxin system Phd/YefM family antitoxin n=1 Tax=Humisphaera borealis TaxID=2807512 RepID=A0A7M2WVY7_9BACT|nr:hypothetical protein [Humisphaera borealis]QOV89494.1 type II toxin-antitoxin system Phd/YefM family antitoxin [Humisphaera borealis]